MFGKIQDITHLYHMVILRNPNSLKDADEFIAKITSLNYEVIPGSTYAFMAEDVQIAKIVGAEKFKNARHNFWFHDKADAERFVVDMGKWLNEGEGNTGIKPHHHTSKADLEKIYEANYQRINKLRDKKHGPQNWRITK